MVTPTRLFDALDYQMERFPQDACLAGKEAGRWVKYSTGEVEQIVNQISAGLMQHDISANDMSIEKRDKVAILSKNRPEWLMVDLAVQQIGAVLVPIYPTINIHELQFVLNDCEAQIIFVNDEELFLKVLSIKELVPTLKEIYTFERVPNAKYWKEILREMTHETREHIDITKSRIRGEDLVTIIYTSGTTGTPKGVMLSHHNILSNVFDSKDFFPLFPGDRALSFLPLNHIFERMVSYIYLYTGVQIWYAESLDTVGDNLKEVKPVMFASVPRLLEKTYEKIIAKGSHLSGIKKKFFDMSIDLGFKYEINKPLPLLYRLKLALIDKLVYSKWREGLGGSVKLIVTGAAACQVKLLRIFTAAGVNVIEGYGLTETSPVIAVNHYDRKGRMFGTVGPIIPNVKVQIADDGEILTKGPHVMMGYYKRPDLTAEVIKDGWFYTGDIGMMVDNTFLKITDRKKEIFKTSGGKYVAPQPIENKMKESNWIEQIMVVGAERKYAAALIVPKFAALREWCDQNHLPWPGNENIIRNEKVMNLIRDDVEKYNQFFNQVEQIKKFELMPYEWSVDGGEMTPTMKLKRKIIMEKNREAIERLY